MRRLLLCAMALALAGATGVRAAPAVPAALVSASAFRYAPGNDDGSTGTLSVPQGWGLFLLNLDPLGPHTVTAAIFDDHGDPIFDSDPINFGSVAEVTPIATLPPGTYPFFCKVHYFMHGVLEVVPVP